MAYFPEITSVADTSRFHAKTRANKPAFIFNDEVLTYREFDRHCSMTANGFAAEGLKPTSRIAFLDKNSPDYFEIMFGAAKAKMVVAPVNWRLAPPEVAYVVNDAKAEILFVGEGFYALVDKIKDQLKTVKKIVAMQGGRPDWEPYRKWRDRQSDKDPMLASGPDDVVIQLYTSGTTGHPKGVMLNNRNFLGNRALVEESGTMNFDPWTEEDVGLVAMPIFHIGGSGYGYTTLYNGAKGIVLQEFTPSGVLKAIRDHKVSKFFIVPAAMKFVMDDPTCKDTDFSSIKMISYGASPIPLDLLRRAIEVFKCGFVQYYGLTETTGSITYLPPEDHDPNGNPRMRSAGKAFPGVEIKIMDGAGKEMPLGDVGEICVRGKQIMPGYWNLDEATKKSISKDGWFRSGDAGYMDKEGYVYVHDRVKDMIVSGGENIYPAEVESAIFGHPAVADVAVIGIPDERWGEAVRAMVVLKPGAKASADDIIGFARERIAGFKCPKTVEFIPALPRNASGKILKRELRAPFWEGRERQVN